MLQEPSTEQRSCVRNVSDLEFMQALKEFGYEQRDKQLFHALPASERGNQAWAEHGLRCPVGWIVAACCKL